MRESERGIFLWEGKERSISIIGREIDIEKGVQRKKECVRKREI